jgi:hypothetical protein
MIFSISVALIVFGLVAGEVMNEDLYFIINIIVELIILFLTLFTSWRLYRQKKESHLGYDDVIYDKFSNSL